MLDKIIYTMASPFVEIGILIILLLAFLRYRNDPRLEITGIKMVRLLGLVLIFLYLMFVWSSSVQPVLTGISIFGMFIVNMVLLYHLLLARLLRPYHNALSSMTQKPEDCQLIHQVWHSGKRYYHVRYAWSSLFSGANPFHFLREIAIDRVRDDIKDSFRRYGVEQRMLNLSAMVAYLKGQIASGKDLQADFQNLMLKTVDDFAKHPYIQEKANEFLRLATERPEEINFPELTAKLDSTSNPPQPCE
ncbi:MAG: hypothetical protein ABSC45_10960 [Desulfobaccales bacterium]|jgi:hypothetical protein